MAAPLRAPRGHRSSPSGSSLRQVRRSAHGPLLPTFSDLFAGQNALMQAVKEQFRMSEEKLRILKYRRVSGIRVNYQLRVGQILGEGVRVDGRNHDVMTPIGDQRWMLDLS
jgi:hypothetical protein